jgi:YgiT-type zinc finger domain-containing protein
MSEAGAKPQRRRPTLDDVLHTLRVHLPELREHYGVRTLGVFGSYVRGEQRPWSDLDLLGEFDACPLTIIQVEEGDVTCRTCGGVMESRVTDLPFKVGDSSIVIVKGLPVMQCLYCHEYVLTDVVMVDVERILAAVDESAELKVVRYAA